MTCHCFTCLDAPGWGFNNPTFMQMILCPKCGNKRCPHARNHENECTGSNDLDSAHTAISDEDGGEQRKGDALRALTLAKEARELDATMSPAPWVADIDDAGTECETWTGKFHTGTEGATWEVWLDDQRTIANAMGCARFRTIVPQLCDTIDSLTARLAVVEAALTVAIDDMRDMRSYVPEHFATKHGHDKAISRAVAALKGDGDDQ